MGWTFWKENKPTAWDRYLDRDLRRGLFFLQAKHQSRALWCTYIQDPEPFAEKGRATLTAGYYLWPCSETKATEDSISLVRRQSGKCGWQRELFWFVGCIFLKTIKPQQSSVCRSAHFLRKCPQKKPVHLWLRREGNAPASLTVLFPWTVSTIQASLRSTQNPASISDVGQEEKTQIQVSSKGLFSCQNLMTSLWPQTVLLLFVSGKASFLLFPQKLHGWQATLFLGPTPRTCLKHTLQVKSDASQPPSPWLASHVLSQNTHNPSIFPKTLLTSEGSVRSLPSSNHSLSLLYFIPCVIVHSFSHLCFTYLFLQTTYGARFTA